MMILLLTMPITFPGFPFNQYTFLSIISYLEAYANKLAFGLNKLIYP